MQRTSSKKIVSLRNKVCKKKNIKILKIFDTNKHEPHKDVVLGEWDKKKIVLRTGEHRPLNFFKKGYVGKNLVIPKPYVINSKLNYEIEEFLEGKQFDNIFPKPKYNKLIIDKEWEEGVIKSFWEFQKIGKRINLKNKINTKEQIEKFYNKAKISLNRKYFDGCDNIIFGEKFSKFWKNPFPSKWKFSPDNLIALGNKKVGFIDLHNVGLRHWGYDLGWQIWPQWFKFSASDYKKANGHFNCIEDFFNVVDEFAPQA